MTATLGDRFLAVLFGPAILAFIVFNSCMAAASIILGRLPIAALYALVCVFDIIVFRATGNYRGEKKNDLLVMPPKAVKS